MWDAPERGKLEGTIETLSRLLGCSYAELKIAINEIKELKIGDIENNNSHCTIINRRMAKEEKERLSNKKRQQKFRENGGGNPENWTAIRVHILERDNYTCAYCGRKANSVDHIIPRSKGGNEDENNLVACCKSCNLKKGDRIIEQAKMGFYENNKK
jgi:5-methylcytosine-specific restriction endonuclease McrA